MMQAVTTARARKNGRIPLLVEGAVLMMCILCVLIALTYANFRHLEQVNRLNIHTYHVLEKIVVLREAISDTELRLRGFALTGDDVSLSSVRQSRKEAAIALADLQKLTTDNASQQQHLRKFTADYVKWREEYADVAANASNEAVRIDNETEVRRAAISRLESQIEHIEKMERALLRERTTQQEMSHRSTARYLLIASICTVTFMGAFIALLGMQIGAAHESNRKLVASQAQLNAVVESAPLVLYSIDTDEKFSLIAGKGAPLLGLTPESTVGKKLDDVLGPSYDQEPIKAALHGAANTSRASIKGFVFETSRLPMRDGEGNITGMIGVGFDVTERVKAEEALRQSEARFRTVIESLQEIVFQIDAQGCWSFLNPAWRLLLGHQVVSSLGTPALDYAPPEDRESIARLMNSSGNNQKESRRELVRIRTRSGDYRWMDANIQLEWDSEGNFVGASGTLSDINDRKLAQEELLATTTLQKAILNSSNYSIIAVNADGNIESFNRAAQELLGYSTEEVRGLESPLIFHDSAEIDERTRELEEETGHPIASGFEALTCKARGGAIEEREWTYISRSGQRIPMRLSISELRGLEGQLSGFLFVGYDLRESRRAESIKNEFVSVVSHELRTPLTSIRGALGLLAGGVAGALPQSAQQMIDIARKNSDRLVLLINDILDIEKIESGKMRFELKPLRVHDLLANALEQNQAYGETLGVKLALEVEPSIGGLQIEGDEDRLQQVLSNLISNACKFTPSGGTVHLQAKAHNGQARIIVLDEGPGVPPEFVPRLFEKFAQADASSTRKQGGTGLGLAIARAIIEKHGGVIQYLPPEEGQGGACFAVDLPLTSEAVEVAPPPARRVLICEDEPVAAELLSLIVQRSGYQADVAFSIGEARAMLAQGGYAGMTLDLMFPDGNGLDFLTELRSAPSTRDFPIIVVSINAQEGALQGEAFNVVDWLRKPVDAGRLLSSLEQFRSLGSPRILHVEDDEDVRHIMAAILDDSARITPAATLKEARTIWQHSVESGEKFDLAILDIGLPDGSGLELVSLFSAADPPVPVIMFSASEASAEEVHLVTTALVKSRTTNEELRESIHHLLSGGDSLGQVRPDSLQS